MRGRPLRRRKSCEATSRGSLFAASLRQWENVDTLPTKRQRKFRVDHGRAHGGAIMADRILPLGDAAFTLELDATPAPEVTARLLALAASLAARPGVTDLAPAFRSLTVHLDPLTADRAALEALALRLAKEGDAPQVAGRAWRAPVCFDAGFGPDQGEVAAETGLAP
ncbi:MAG: hypothetical protein CVT71_01720, partial [Alphaproteobacteria bacterium HGW-Alphaproteobacteria-10]